MGWFGGKPAHVHAWRVVATIPTAGESLARDFVIAMSEVSAAGLACEPPRPAPIRRAHPYLGDGPGQWEGDVPLPYVQDGRYYKPVRERACEYQECECGERRTVPLYAYEEERSSFAWERGGRMPDLARAGDARPISPPPPPRMLNTDPGV